MDLTVIKILMMIVGFTMSVLSITCVTIYYLWPSLIIRIMMWYNHQKCGVKIKYITHEGYTFCYFTRGKPGAHPSVLILHGFGINKDMWLGTVELFPKDLHFICIDMPGHGETSQLPGESYTAAAQVKRIHQFVECSGLNRKPFQLVGTSMGGMIAGVYAAKYPSEICSLALLCPAGLRYPTDNEFVKHMKTLEKLKALDKNPLIPLTVEQGEDLMKLGCYHEFKINRQIIKGFLDCQRPHTAFLQKCFLDVFNEESRHSLDDNMSKIHAKTQIIWGKDDKILDPAGAEILAKAIPNSQVHMLEKCGHFIVMDRPKKSAKLIREFCTSACGTIKHKKLE